jgi:hypothetical protein
MRLDLALWLLFRIEAQAQYLAATKPEEERHPVQRLQAVPLDRIRQGVKAGLLLVHVQLW